MIVKTVLSVMKRTKINADSKCFMCKPWAHMIFQFEMYINIYTDSGDVIFAIILFFNLQPILNKLWMYVML